MYEAVGADAGSELATTGTTGAGAVVQPGSLLAFNVGDSRVFTASGDGLRQVSVDDSPPLAPGRRTTSLGTQCLGTDGLTDPLTADVLDEVIREYDDGRAAFELWMSAIAAGGPDTITPAIVRVGEESAEEVGDE